MRPYPDELLAIMRRSLRSVVTPKVTDNWGRYVAKSLERLAEHLERRWQLELRYLAEDTEEMRELFAELRPELEELSSREELAPVVDSIETLRAEPSLASRVVEPSALNRENEAHREALERLIFTLAQIDEGPGIDRARHRIRAYLRRQLDRDVALAEPTFMHFGPRPKGGKK